jgi:hypothetical protein
LHDKSFTKSQKSEERGISPRRNFIKEEDQIEKFELDFSEILLGELLISPQK